MAVSSTSSSSTASIDVASIVTQLMTVENKPLDAIKAKITQQQLIISELGVVKSKLSTLNTALTTFKILFRITHAKPPPVIRVLPQLRQVMGLRSALTMWSLIRWPPPPAMLSLTLPPTASW